VKGITMTPPTHKIVAVSIDPPSLRSAVMGVPSIDGGGCYSLKGIHDEIYTAREMGQPLVSRPPA